MNATEYLRQLRRRSDRRLKEEQRRMRRFEKAVELITSLTDADIRELQVVRQLAPAAGEGTCSS